MINSAISIISNNLLSAAGDSPGITSTNEVLIGTGICAYQLVWNYGKQSSDDISPPVPFALLLEQLIKNGCTEPY